MATIEFNCASCGHHYKVPVAAAGRKAKCKKCGGAIEVPAARTVEEIDMIDLKEVDPPQARPAKARPAASGKRPAAKKKQASSSSSENVDLGALYAAEPEPVEDASALDALAAASGPSFSFEASSGAATRTRSRPAKKNAGLPMPLLLAGGGGALVLLIVVVVMVVVLSGGDDEPEDAGTGTGLAVNTPSATGNDGQSFSLTPSNTGVAPAPQDEGPEDPDPEIDLEPVITFVPFPADGDALTDWTIPLDKAVAEAAREVQRAGVIFTTPTTWQSESKPSDDGTPQIRDTVAVSPDETISVLVSVGKFGSTTPPIWPTLMTVDEAPSDLTQEELLFGTPEPWRGPNEFILVPDHTAEDVRFGTMFGGYRFARFAVKGTQSGNTAIHAVHYIGTAGSLYIHITVKGENADPALLAEAEWIARSARLMTDSGLEAFAKKNGLFQDWLKESAMKIPRAQDKPPVAEAEPDAWPGFAAGSDFEAMMAMAGAAGPRRSPYRIAPPEGLELAAVSRLAVRWRPNEDGLWLAMETRDLGSRWRRTVSPVLGQDRAMIAGSEMQLPDGTEQSELDVKGTTVYRFLMPDRFGADYREVYYVVLDRGVLVTVIGRYSKSRPGDLDLLDASVMTFNKS